MAETAATRSTALALADERELMHQGHRFLDEKRVLLAAAILRELATHEELLERLRARLQAARPALRAALQRHGLQGLQAQPAVVLVPPAPRAERTRLLGLTQLHAVFDPSADVQAASQAAIDPSPEARACAAAFVSTLGLLAGLAAAQGNLERLAVEYHRTERRALALENVLLPEIEVALKAIDEQLELADQEEAVQVRLASGRR